MNMNINMNNRNNNISIGSGNREVPVVCRPARGISTVAHQPFGAPVPTHHIATH